VKVLEQEGNHDKDIYSTDYWVVNKYLQLMKETARQPAPAWRSRLSMHRAQTGVAGDWVPNPRTRVDKVESHQILACCSRFRMKVLGWPIGYLQVRHRVPESWAEVGRSLRLLIISLWGLRSGLFPRNILASINLWGVWGRPLSGPLLLIP
jgi:hypothetical protein